MYTYLDHLSTLGKIGQGKTARQQTADSTQAQLVVDGDPGKTFTAAAAPPRRPPPPPHTTTTAAAAASATTTAATTAAPAVLLE